MVCVAVIALSSTLVVGSASRGQIDAMQGRRFQLQKKSTDAA
jgi:hypothetical protein